MNLNTITTIEEGSDSPFEYYAAVQDAINSGSAWSFQGSFGRTMMDAIRAGYCMLGRVPAVDYWGNRIPSRFEVKEGTPGSAQFVAEQCDQEWADAMARIGTES